jgi:hypothetical protein
MTTAVVTVPELPWWKEPTKDQWMAWGRGLARLDAELFRLHHLPTSHGADRG